MNEKIKVRKGPDEANKVADVWRCDVLGGHVWLSCQRTCRWTPRPPFATQALARLSPLSVWWVRLGILPELRVDLELASRAASPGALCSPRRFEDPAGTRGSEKPRFASA